MHNIRHHTQRYPVLPNPQTLLPSPPTPGERSQVAQQWNQLRREIVTTALTQQLLPAFTQHYRAKLLAEARDAAVRE